MTSQKNRSTLVFRDQMGITHTCYRAGQKRIVHFDLTNGSIEEALIAAIRNEFHDSSIRHGVSVKSLSNMNVYIVHSHTNFYIVKPHFDGSIEIFFNGIFGFPIQDGYSYNFEVHGNTIVFWMCDKYSRMRIGHYKFVE
mgnify:FL=1